MSTSPDNAFQKIASNRRAFHDYLVLEKCEAGIELRGTEVKSVREGNVNLGGGYARIEDGQALLYHVNISPYEQGNRFNHDPDRPRRLLLHKREIRKLHAETEQKGRSLIPLSVYFKRGRVKIELGLCKGKREEDKRETLRRRTADREAARAIAAHRR